MKHITSWEILFLCKQMYVRINSLNKIKLSKISTNFWPLYCRLFLFRNCWTLFSSQNLGRIHKPIFDLSRIFKFYWVIPVNISKNIVTTSEYLVCKRTRFNSWNINKNSNSNLSEFEASLIFKTSVSTAGATKETLFRKQNK